MCVGSTPSSPSKCSLYDGGERLDLLVQQLLKLCLVQVEVCGRRLAEAQPKAERRQRTVKLEVLGVERRDGGLVLGVVVLREVRVL